MQDIQTIVDSNPKWDTKRSAEYLGMMPSTLECWRVRGGGPQFIKMGRSVRYSKADLDQFIEAGRRSITVDA